jgi:hypothetical protein
MATWMVLLKHISGPIQPMESKNSNKPNIGFTTRRKSSGVNYHVLFIFIFFLTLSLSGCVTMADPEASQVYNSDTVGILAASTEIGQSFVSRRPDLNGITLWLTPLSSQNGDISPSEPNYINIKLYLGPEKAVLIYAADIIAPSTGETLPVSVNIPNLHTSPDQEFFLLLSKSQGTIGIDGRNEDAYSNGQAYLNGIPIDADIAFRLSYDYGIDSLLGDFKGLGSKIWVALPLLIVLWLPGWLILDATGLRKYFDLGEQTAMAVGLSLISIPLVMLWTTILKIKWTGTAVLFLASLLVAILIIRLFFLAYSAIKNRVKTGNSPSVQGLSIFRHFSRITTGQSIVLILIFFGSLAVRLIMVRDLATPAWVDSVHHALITRLIMEAGAYPSTYLPYLAISPSAYHPGFHSIAAIFTWLSKLDIAQSLLILGQALNALSVLSVYLFTKILTRKSTAGLFAAIITGFITPMPAYYTSWGRYTELTGLLVLPVVIALLQLWLDGEVKIKSSLIILLGAFALGGLFMIHYRVIAFLVALLIAYVVMQFITRRTMTHMKIKKLLWIISLTSILGIIIVLPWFLQAMKTTVLPIVTTPYTTAVGFFQDFSWPYLTSALGKQSLVLAILGLCWSAIKRERFVFLLLFWVFVMFFFANLVPLKIPGGGLISNASVEIMLFIPISILGGYFLDQILTSWNYLLPQRLLVPAKGAILIFMGFVSYLGARELIPIINPVTILSRQADLPAIQWINDHIPKDETIIINPFAWGYGLYGGSDGGYWISPLSGRQSIPPPVLYGLSNETGAINQLSQAIITQSPDPAAFRDLLLSENFQYIYTGTKGGVIPPEKLASSGLFTALYHQDNVWILHIKP